MRLQGWIESVIFLPKASVILRAIRNSDASGRPEFAFFGAVQPYSGHGRRQQEKTHGHEFIGSAPLGQVVWRLQLDRKLCTLAMRFPIAAPTESMTSRLLLQKTPFQIQSARLSLQRIGSKCCNGACFKRESGENPE